MVNVLMNNLETFIEIPDVSEEILPLSIEIFEKIVALRRDDKATILSKILRFH